MQLNILAQVRVIFTRHTDTFSYNFQQRPGLGRGFQRLFASILLPPGKEIFPVSKVTCFVCLFLLFFFFSETLLSRNTYLFLLGGGPSLPSGVLLFLGDLFHSGNLKSLVLKHDLLHEAVKQGG